MLNSFAGTNSWYWCLAALVTTWLEMGIKSSARGPKPAMDQDGNECAIWHIESLFQLKNVKHRKKDEEDWRKENLTRIILWCTCSSFIYMKEYRKQFRKGCSKL